MLLSRISVTLGIDCIDSEGVGYRAAKEAHESLTVRIFLITLLILLGAGAITFALIARATLYRLHSGGQRRSAGPD